MKLLERFRAQPAWQSDDPAVRAAAVRELPPGDDARELLLEIARHDADGAVRLAAIAQMADLTTLLAFLQDPGTGEPERPEAEATLRDLAIATGDDRAGIAAVDVLTEERDLMAVARAAELEAVGLAALERLSADRSIGGVARRARHVSIALEAVRRIGGRDELAAVAIKTDDKATALAAYERLVGDASLEAATLDEIARRARQKSVARRARAAVVDRQAPPEAAAPEAGDAARAMCEGLEALAGSVAALDEGRRALDAALERWSGLDEAVDSALAERFAAARRAVEDRLLELDATGQEAARAAAQRSAAETARVALCERVERLTTQPAGELAEALRVARAEWAALEPVGALATGDDDDAGDLRASLTRIETRFTAAVAAGDARLASLATDQARLRALDQLAGELEQLVATADPAAVGRRWSALDKRWRHEMSALGSTSSGAEAAGDAAVATLLARKAAVDEKHHALDVTAREARAARTRDQLARLQTLVADVERAVGREDLALGEAERQLRRARQVLDKLPPLPTRRDREEIGRRLRDGSTALLGRVRELRDFADWQRWANLGVQEELCREMEALAAPPEGAPAIDDAALARTFRDIMKRWRLAADVPRDKGQALWERFKRAHDLVYPRCEALFAAQKAEREKNRERRLALVAEAERLRDSTEWVATAQRLTALQAEWKALGPAPRKQQRELWDRFRGACGAFFARRKADLADRKRVWAENYRLKDALCARVEALAEVDELPAAIEEAKRAQAEWKQVGPVKRSRSEAIWQRFRTACDGVFDRLQEGDRRAAAERIAAREALCAELETLLAPDPSPADGAEAESGVETAAAPPAAAATPPAAATASQTATRSLAEAVRDLQDRWRQAPDVPPDVRRKLSARFGQAITRLVEQRPDQFRDTDLDPARKLKRLEALCKRAEALVPAEALDEAGASPAEILARKWRDQLAANTMGVRVDEAAKKRAAVEEVKRLQAERRRIGPLPGEAAAALAARFQRACDRAMHS